MIPLLFIADTSNMTLDVVMSKLAPKSVGSLRVGLW